MTIQEAIAKLVYVRRECGPIESPDDLKDLSDEEREAVSTALKALESVHILGGVTKGDVMKAAFSDLTVMHYPANHVAPSHTNVLIHDKETGKALNISKYWWHAPFRLEERERYFNDKRYVN